ncbi:probable protein cornichon homolog 4 [Coccomyxa sp. Obi]|nr:probable protein cornichon homolog 4 [Coccomyxa sp. Obi]
MYGLIILSDLENDFINPHDSSASLNTWVMPEYIAQAALTALLLFSGKWLSGLVMLLLVAWNVRTYLRDEHKVDVTEVFRQIPREKNIRIVKLIFYLLGFVYFIYRLIITLVEYFDEAYPPIQKPWEHEA